MAPKTINNQSLIEKMKIDKNYYRVKKVLKLL